MGWFEKLFLNEAKAAAESKQSASPEQIEDAVNEYLEENPVDGTSITITSVTQSSEDGGKNIVTFSDGKTLTVKNGSKGSKGDKGDTGETGPQGEKGDKGDTGVQGIQGEQGIQGIQGESGKDGTSVTVTKVSESTADGGSNIVTFSDGKTLTVKNGSKGSQGVQGDKGDKGDTGANGSNGKDGSDGADGVGIKSVVQTTTSTADGGSNIVTVTKTDNTTSTFTVKNGSKGSKGDKGDTGTTGPKGADGHTPVKGTDYFTEADKAEMIEKVTASLEGIPDYWQTALDEGVAAINQAIETAGANKSAFLFYTDAHWGYGSGMSPKLLKYLCDNTAINKVNFGGDYMNSYNVAEGEYLATMRAWRKAVRHLPNHHSVIGNHDYYDTYIPELGSDAQQYGFLFAPEETNDVVRGNYFHYYVDSQPEKTRYLYLDTGLLAVSDESYQFTVDALKSTPDGWHIVVISHVWFVYDDTSTPTVGSSPEYCRKLFLIFSDYNMKQAGVVYESDISYDFTSAGGRVEFCIGGHTHVDHDFVATDGIPVILCQTDSYHCRGDYTATPGTITEASVSGIIADYDNNKITIVRVGRGEGREVSITVTTEEIPYTNVLPLAVGADGQTIYNDIGYAANTRWSSSSGAEITGTGIYLSGYIPVSNGDVIRLKNITMDKNINGNGCRVLLCASIGATPAIQNADNLTTHNAAVWDTDGLLTQFNVSGCAFIRLQADYIGADSIVTINEPIE